MPTPLEEFLQACEEHAVFIDPEPLEAAQTDFGLNTEEEVMDYLANLGAAEFIARPVTPLKKPRWRPPPPPPDIPVHAFNFWALSNNVKRAYFAFYRSPLTGLFMLKSFKLDPDTGKNLSFRDPKLLELRRKLVAEEGAAEGGE